MQSVFYLRVKIKIEHAETVDPQEVINEMDYNFISSHNNAEITETEIQDSERKGGE